MTYVVGLTGGIGSGKSTVSALLAKQGAVVIDADAIVHEVQAPGSPVLAAIVREFGDEILTEDGELDREALGAIIFADAAARARLGQIVHPAVGIEMGRRLTAARAAAAPLIVLDIPLLLEGREAGGPQRDFDAIVVVYAPQDVQLARQQLRDGRGREEALARIHAQMPMDRKRELADVVIDNSGTRDATERQVRAFYQRVTAPSEAAP